jgi:hypothetical protein
MYQLLIDKLLLLNKVMYHDHYYHRLIRSIEKEKLNLEKQNPKKNFIYKPDHLDHHQVSELLKMNQHLLIYVELVLNKL